MRIFSVVALAVLVGCQNVNGVFDVQEGDCSIFNGHLDANGTLTNVEGEGAAYVRRGNCTPEDRAAATG